MFSLETALLLTIANVIFLLVLVYLSIRINVTKRNLVAETHLVKTDLTSLCRVSSNIDKRIDAIDVKIRRLSERQEKTEASDIVKREYDNAIRAVKSGASLDKLINIHGLSQAEAKMLVSLHSEQ